MGNFPLLPLLVVFISSANSEESQNWPNGCQVILTLGEEQNNQNEQNVTSIDITKSSYVESVIAIVALVHEVSAFSSLAEDGLKKTREKLIQLLLFGEMPHHERIVDLLSEILLHREILEPNDVGLILEVLAEYKSQHGIIDELPTNGAVLLIQRVLGWIPSTYESTNFQILNRSLSMKREVALRARKIMEAALMQSRSSVLGINESIHTELKKSFADEIQKGNVSDKQGKELFFSYLYAIEPTSFPFQL